MSNKAKFLNQIKKVNLGSKQELQNFEIHFEGFYHSEHSDIIDYKLESCLEWGDEETENQESYDFNINWKETHINYSKEYVKALNDMLDLDLKFVSLNSPSYYNYETDKIEVSINRDDILKLKREYNYKKEFVDYVNEQTKSYDGFISFYKDFEAVKNDSEMNLVYIFKYILCEYADDIQENSFELEFEIIRSKTFPGMAKAIANQINNQINNL
tara:strand:+ start:435 stop:1076 length:642 start_codon:yes stop_codon:yes gene_type:complete